jgi:hypothetical protein
MDEALAMIRGEPFTAVHPDRLWCADEWPERMGFLDGLRGQTRRLVNRRLDALFDQKPDDFARARWVVGQALLAYPLDVDFRTQALTFARRLGTIELRREWAKTEQAFGLPLPPTVQRLRRTYHLLE